MVKTILLISLFTVLLVLTACTPLYCSTPYILYQGTCCLDSNKDGQCDTGNFASEPTITLPPSEPTALPQAPSPSVSLPKTKEGTLLKISSDDDPFLGDPDATVLFTEFGDYADKNTYRFHTEVLPQILDAYGSYIKYTFRNYPDLTNERSIFAAEASECADEQGKFWEYHRILLENYDSLSTSFLKDYAAEAGLDLPRFDTCFDNHRYTDEVLQDQQDGYDYGVYVSPTFFINNQHIPGYRNYPAFQAALEDALHEELKILEGVSVSASSLGKRAYLILEGPAALDPSVSNSPYTDTLDFVDSSFTFSSVDRTPSDTPQTQDEAQFTATFTVKKLQELTEDVYTITLIRLTSEGVAHSFFGGVGTNKLMNGNTGIGTSYLPASTVYVSVWGVSDVYKNNQLIASNATTHFMITPALRDSTTKKLLSRVLASGNPEAYLLLSGKFSGAYLSGTEQGFLYLYWDQLDLRR